jgi:hypothetical protein
MSESPGKVLLIVYLAGSEGPEYFKEASEGAPAYGTQFLIGFLEILYLLVEIRASHT